MDNSYYDYIRQIAEAMAKHMEIQISGILSEKNNNTDSE